ncbi:MAG: hypothetical protein SVY53_03815 [Chloroflexota bacterium]|nr:hypothetical protein [Chloroflexota bacterium]
MLSEDSCGHFLSLTNQERSAYGGFHVVSGIADKGSLFLAAQHIFVWNAKSVSVYLVRRCASDWRII